MAYTKKTWTEGTQTRPAKVTIDGTDYNVTPETRTGATPATAVDMNHIEQGIKDNDTAIGTLSNLNTTAKSNLVGSINEINVRSEGVPTYGSQINNSNTNVRCQKRGNIVTVGGVIYFTVKPGTWTTFMTLPDGYHGLNGMYGVLIEEATGLIRPVVVDIDGNVKITANISNANLYTYIVLTMVI